LLGLTGGHLSKILSGADGRTVKISHLAKISQALNLPMSSFFQDFPLKVPVIGEIDAYGGPPTLAADAKEGDEYVDLPF
jgi:transcriptional regulator with XRE-family HTH domain